MSYSQLELRAILELWKFFTTVRILLYRKTAVLYVAKQGSMKSLTLLQIAGEIFIWAEQYLKDLAAVCLPSCAKSPFLVEFLCNVMRLRKRDERVCLVCFVGGLSNPV